MEFSHLHVYPSFTQEDYTSYSTRLLNYAAKHGHSALALTGKSSLESASEFCILAQQKGIKPIIGMEVKLSIRLQDIDLKSADAPTFSLVLLAKNTTGIANLKKLEKLSRELGTEAAPAITAKTLTTYKEGLIAISGDLNSEIAMGVLNGPPQAPNDVVVWCKMVFGKDYYLEVILHRDLLTGQHTETTLKQSIVNNVIRDMARLHQVKLVATNAVSFVQPEETTNSEDDFVSSTGQEYLKSAEEMDKLFIDFPGAVSNTQEIVSKVSY